MDWAAQQFERNREHLFAVAYRLLGSAAEAEDAVQETWLRLSRTDEADIRNLEGWMTTVVARIGLDMLRVRKVRKEEQLAPDLSADGPASTNARNPEQEALLAEAVGVALLVVLDRLTPAERLSFVLHDVFDLTFEEIAPILQRPPGAVRQLASRGRRRIGATTQVPSDELAKQRKIATTFLTALRAGDLQGLLAVLDPDLTVNIDETAAIPGQPRSMHGAAQWAEQAIRVSRGARATQSALIDGTVGVVVAPFGKLLRVLRLQFSEERIVRIDVVSDADGLAQLAISTLSSS